MWSVCLRCYLCLAVSVVLSIPISNSRFFGWVDDQLVLPGERTRHNDTSTAAHGRLSFTLRLPFCLRPNGVTRVLLQKSAHRGFGLRLTDDSALLYDLPKIADTAKPFEGRRQPRLPDCRYRARMMSRQESPQVERVRSLLGPRPASTSCDPVTNLSPVAHH
jgi:hypothetical protein